ncbi:MAG: potassium transporter TrkG [Candidatus Kaelpia imicola]|nr:potassium transporter TrkG [Candidatus Kaelpia imicola]
MQIKPARIIILSFLSVIIAGTLLFLLPASTSQQISLIDALFTATSATCVTGLIVNDTGSFFTPLGQGIIMLLFQLGGLGIMTFSTIFALMLGRRITITGRKTLSLAFENIEFDIKLLLKGIIVFTILIELLGACLFKLFLPGIGVFSALFHSTSAFCNAGFSLFETSFQKFRSSESINILMTTLIIAGGLGFLVLFDLACWAKGKILKRESRLTLHSKIVIAVSLILILTGISFLFIAEGDHLFSEYSFSEKCFASYFQSVTARTAGFNTVEIGSLQKSSKLMLGALMFIGASPGSTGGGIKTVTFALIVLGLIALLRGSAQIRIAKRAISMQVFEKAIVIFVLSVVWIFFATTILSITESRSFLDVLFEVVSAFGTVGLSCGITAGLTTVGKLIIILTMFFGRIGPMTLAIALARCEEVDFKLPEENVMVG